MEVGPRYDGIRHSRQSQPHRAGAKESEQLRICLHKRPGLDINESSSQQEKETVFGTILILVTTRHNNTPTHHHIPLSNPTERVFISTHQSKRRSRAHTLNRSQSEKKKKRSKQPHSQRRVNSPPFHSLKVGISSHCCTLSYHQNIQKSGSLTQERRSLSQLRARAKRSRKIKHVPAGTPRRPWIVQSEATEKGPHLVVACTSSWNRSRSIQLQQPRIGYLCGNLLVIRRKDRLVML